MRRVAFPRAGRTGLLAAAALFAVFLGLGTYHWLYSSRPVLVTNADLQAELARAKLDTPPLSPDRGWPGWRGPFRDGTATATVGALGAAGPPERWRVKGGEGYSSFAVGPDGHAYTMLRDGEQEAVVKLALADGTEVARHDYPTAYTNDQGTGPRSTPAYDDDGHPADVERHRVYAVSPWGLLHCLKASDLSVVWHLDLGEAFGARPPRWGVSFSPLVVGDRLFVQPGGAGGNSVAALDKRTGAVLWKALDDGPSFSSPVYATLDGVPQVLFFTAKGLVGVAPDDGRELWRFPWETSFDVNAATPLVVNGTVEGAPVSYVFISSGYDRGCALVNVRRRGGGWRAEAVYTGNQMCNHFSSSVRRGDHLYGFHESQLACMDVRSGRVLWKKAGREGFGKGTLLTAGDHLVVLSEFGTKLALVRADPEKYDEVWAVKPLRQQRAWAMPALAAGRLLVRNGDEIVCYDVTGG